MVAGERRERSRSTEKRSEDTEREGERERGINGSAEAYRKLVAVRGWAMLQKPSQHPAVMEQTSLRSIRWVL